MRRVLHISDLHFGRARPELLEPLLAAIAAAAPDLVTVSGDLTQRARNWQFEEARSFLDAVSAPILVVPGNHDVPLDNVPLRFLRPWSRYRKWIGWNLEPAFEDDELSVVGVNTVNPFSRQRGKLADRATRRVCAAFAGDRTGRTRIVVVHHPLEHAPGERKQLMRGASRAIDALSDCGADVILSGHLHAWRADPFAARRGRTGVLQVQAGTGLSTRLRGEENDFNLLTLAPGEIVVERFVAGDRARGFTPAARLRFRTSDRGWARDHFPEMPASRP